MSKDNKKIRAKQIALALILLAIFAGIAAAIIWLMTGKESTITVDDDVSVTKYLYCSTTNPEGDFFASENTKSTKHEIRFTFTGENLNKIAYTYTGTYDQTQDLEQEMSALETKYSKYMRGAEAYASLLSPTWNIIDNDIVANFLIKREDYNPTTARLIFMDSNEYVVNRQGVLNKLQSFYEGKGFSCRSNS